MTSTILLLAVGLVSVPFSSCSTPGSAYRNSVRNTVAHPDHQTTAAIAHDNASPDGPDTFGNPLVEF
jgi:hypothetical protein